MANRKITVVGDGAEEPLTPEEEHKIEVKIDKMLDPNQPDEPKAVEAAKEPELPKEKPTPKPKAKVTKIITKFADEPDEAEEPQESTAEIKTEPIEAEAIGDLATNAHSAPPLPKKPSKKILIKHHDEPEEETASDDIVSEDDAITADAPKAKTTKIITKFADEPQADDTSENKPEEVRTTSPDFDAIQAAALAAEAKIKGPKAPEPAAEELSETTDDIPTDEQTEISATEEPAEPEVKESPRRKQIITTFADDADDKPEELGPIEEPEAEDTTAEPEKPKPAEPPQKPSKPDPLPALRPIAFPRAKPVETEEIVDDITSAPASDTVGSEDAAIAHAFDAKKTSVGEKLGQIFAAIFSGRVLRALIIIVVLAAIITPLAMPKVRAKLTHYVHDIHSTSSAKKPSPQTSTIKSTAPVTPASASPEDVYVAKQNGTYNVYKSDTAGQNQKQLLAGTGNEQLSDMTLATNVLDTSAVLVSGRTKSADTLTSINVSTGTTATIDQADQIKLVDWFGDRIVYVLIKAETTTSDASRYQLISYDTKTKQRLQLDHANYFNDVLSAKGAVYYATSNTNAGGSSQLIKVSPDSVTSKQVLLNQEVWRIYRTDYNDLALATANAWYTYKIGDTKPVLTSSAYTGQGRLYVDNEAGTQSLWIDSTKNALMIYNISTGKDSFVSSQANLTYPVSWLSNDSFVFRVTTTSQASDYTASVQSNTPKLVSNVSPVNGISLWFQQ